MDPVSNIVSISENPLFEGDHDPVGYGHHFDEEEKVSTMLQSIRQIEVSQE